jgi:hypothetical protein
MLVATCSAAYCQDWSFPCGLQLGVAKLCTLQRVEYFPPECHVIYIFSNVEFQNKNSRNRPFFSFIQPMHNSHSRLAPQNYNANPVILYHLPPTTSPHPHPLFPPWPVSLSWYLRRTWARILFNESIITLEGSRRPKNRCSRRFFGSVARPSAKTSKMKSTFLEKVDGRRSRKG